MPVSEEQYYGTAREDWLQLKRWNQDVPEEYHACVHYIFENQVELRPEAPAVCAWDGCLSYDKLDQLSARLGSYLATLGVRNGVYVPFCFEKSLWAVVATAAILKAGGAYVPLDPSHPSDRLLGILEDVGAKIVLTSSLHAELLSGSTAQIVPVSSEFLDSLQDRPMPEAFHHHSSPTDPVVVLFTSGSTGRPKGVVLQHAAIATHARSHGEALLMNQDSRVLQFAAHVWDIATMDIWTTLMHGGCVCIPSEQERRSDIAGAMERMQVNWALLTPSFVVDLLQPDDVPGLKVLVLAGEPMKQEIISKWSEKVRLLNTYGPAESGLCTAIEYGSKESKAENIGKRMPASLCWITDVDDHEKLVPIGSVGELLVEGPPLALGYLGDENKTKMSFIENPKFLQSNRSTRQRRLYKTGDLAQYCLDGSLNFKGRRDNQVKIRGQRVELSEIESHVEIYSGVSRAIVCYPRSGPFKDQLVSIVQTSSIVLETMAELKVRPTNQELGGSSTLTLQSQLLQWLSDRLPVHMVPNIVILIEALPLTLSAKIDRKRIEDWLLSMSPEEVNACCHNVRDSISKEPLFQSEETALKLSLKIAGIVDEKRVGFGKALLGHDFILLDLGIDSIQYIKLLTFVKLIWGTSIPLAMLTGSRTTVRLLAQFIDSAGSRDKVKIQQVSAAALLTEVATFVKQLTPSINPLAPCNCTNCHRDFSTVLLTGTTGFLGTQILWHLLLQSTVKRVIAHVRAENAHIGLERIIDIARKSGWWQEKYVERIEIWVGDLAVEPHLGLSAEQWDRIRGFGENPIDAIIHNGARVHWMQDYDTLKPTNVNSTVHLLRASLESSSLSRFIYVSGGQQLRLLEQNDQERAEEAIKFNGYAQTKLVSELLVREAGRLDSVVRERPSRFQVVKPGYIIGTTEKGIANPDDFLWRLAAGVIEVKGYNLADQKSFLFISSVDRVANIIANSCLSANDMGSDSNKISVFDGLTMEEFWDVVRRCCFNLQPMEEAAWLGCLREITMRTGEKHPLYPCLHMMETEKMRIASPSHPVNLVSAERKAQIKAAIWSNVKYLVDTGFFSQIALV